MTRLLHVSGDIPPAKRTLRLYVQVSNKARETKSVDEVLPFEEHVDSDSVFVTLVQGVGMLCRAPGDVNDVRQAGKLIEVSALRGSWRLIDYLFPKNKIQLRDHRSFPRPSVILNTQSSSTQHHQLTSVPPSHFHAQQRTETSLVRSYTLHKRLK